MINNETPSRAGSNPAPATNFPQENSTFPNPRTVCAQVFPSRRRKKVTYPRTIEYRKQAAKIYAPSHSTPYYRVTWQSAGKRSSRQFKAESNAVAHAEKVVRDLAKGGLSGSLTAKQERDALAAFNVLDGYRRTTGRSETLHQLATAYTEAMTALGGHGLRDAIDGYLKNVSMVKSVEIQDAIERFCTTTARNLAERTAEQRTSRLRRFAKMFCNMSVQELTKELIDMFFNRLDLAPKTRNHYRSDLKAFLKWAVKKDYLHPQHRLNDSEGLSSEKIKAEEIDYYSPSVLDALLDAADHRLLPLIALGGLAGLRTQELMRIQWRDVLREDNDIVVSKEVAKGRYRRLVPIEPRLNGILSRFENAEGRVWPISYKQYQRVIKELFKSIGVKPIDNGLRHSFCTYHYALHGDEKLTAEVSGNSPNILHRHYRGVARKKDARAWFAIDD